MREERLDGAWQLLLGPPGLAEGAEVREERMSWETFAHTLNDHRRLKHGQILTAVWVATLHAQKGAERKRRGSEKSDES